jgi:hypothetical protein
MLGSHAIRGAALLVAAACAALPACGRKTLVKPPELVAPERIQNLTATNGPDGIRLTWERPTRYADGSRMFDLGAFHVERSMAGIAFAPLATVEVTDRDRIQQVRHFRWVDADTSVGLTYQYRVISLTTDGYVSQPSNIATLERAIPTPAAKPTPTPASR